MSISLNVQNITSGVSKRISMDFVHGYVMPGNGDLGAKKKFYFSLSTSGRDSDNAALPSKLITGLDSLVLNGAKQKRDNSADPYASITEMINDYVYDYINGHTANENGSGVSEQKPMAI
jgi:hypothetical protein